MKKPDPELIDKDNPEWTGDVFAQARPAREVFPDLVEYSEKRKRGQRGPQKAPRKIATSLRLDRDVLGAYKATGNGWQTKINEVLRKGMKHL